MKIAVLGWGSLIWCPGCLRIKTRWRKDGPELPIEFARISSRDRLTLVIYPGAEAQHTLWGVSEYGELEEARENLRDREGCRSLKPIHALDRRGKTHGKVDTYVVAAVRDWLEQDDLDWTGLGCNWEEKRSCDFCVEDAIHYLRCLTNKSRSDAAEEYIRNAPAQIRTAVRERVEREFA